MTYNTPQRHVLTILHLAKKPITQEQLTAIAPKLGCHDTPQSLRSRTVELERAGYVHRVDRNGLSSHKRPCWRWQLTRKGQEFIKETLTDTTTTERN